MGGYPTVSGAHARQKAAELRNQATDGKPLVTQSIRKAADSESAENSFEIVGREWHASRINGWDPGTAKRILGALEKHVFPVFGKRPHSAILPMEWMEFFRGMEQKGIIKQASRVRRYCAEIYDLARVTGRAVHNPIEGQRKFLQTSKASNFAHISAT